MASAACRRLWILPALSAVVLASMAGGVLAEEGDPARSASLHWSFQRVVRPSVPAVRRTDMVANPIDAFLLSRLEAENLSFAPAAGRRELLRRVKFDLLGLPPTPDEVDRFVADDSPGAYERLIDQFLASPHYGEHWGRMWLDVVRYAETAGYNADPLRPHAWKFRDYVVSAFNADKPFDRFVEEQIAGDELFPDDPQAVIGSGYTLMWPDESNASNILLARQDALNDLTANVGAAFLGLSIGCAQCHDHKFDPLPQHDFYRLQAFFAGLIRREQAPLGTPAQLAAYRESSNEWLALSAPLRDELQRLEFEARVKASGDKRMKFPQIVLDALDAAAENRTTMQRQLAFWSERQIEIKEAELVAHLTEDQQQRRTELKRLLAEIEQRRPQPPTELTGMVAGEIEATPPPTYLLAGGSYDKPLVEVAPGFLTVLMPDGASNAIVSAPHPYSSGRRSALARWLSNSQHPLVPRVIVNRIWQGHFGRGLVENGNDFGTQSPPPSHPELLDWLAAQFVSPTSSPPLRKGGQGGSAELASEVESAGNATPPNPPFLRGGEGGAWSLKRLHRLIVTSTAYRQASDRRSIAAADAGRAGEISASLYASFPRRRLPAESLRDALLAVSGQLNPNVQGPSVYPELPRDFSKREAWKVSANPFDRQRRSIYIHAKRNLPYPLLEAFDLPDMHESCARRTQTTVAPQALMLLNSELVLDYAQSLAGRLLLRSPHAVAEQVIVDGYRLAFGREPVAAEIERATLFLNEQQILAEGRRAAGEPVLVPRDFPRFLDPARGAAVVDFCHALLNASEFLYVD